MQFTVTYEDGVWAFKVTSTGDESEYLEEFEIDDEAEAMAVAAELVEEIRELSDNEQVDGYFGGTQS